MPDLTCGLDARPGDTLQRKGVLLTLRPPYHEDAGVGACQLASRKAGQGEGRARWVNHLAVVSHTQRVRPSLARRQCPRSALQNPERRAEHFGGHYRTRVFRCNGLVRSDVGGVAPTPVGATYVVSTRVLTNLTPTPLLEVARMNTRAERFGRITACALLLTLAIFVVDLAARASTWWLIAVPFLVTPAVVIGQDATVRQVQQAIELARPAAHRQQPGTELGQ